MGEVPDLEVRASAIESRGHRGGFGGRGPL